MTHTKAEIVTIDEVLKKFHVNTKSDLARFVIITLQAPLLSCYVLEHNSTCPVRGNMFVTLRLDKSHKGTKTRHHFEFLSTILYLYATEYHDFCNFLLKEELIRRTDSEA